MIKTVLFLVNQKQYFGMAQQAAQCYRLASEVAIYFPVQAADYSNYVFTLHYIFMPQLSIDDLIAEIINSINTQEPRVTVNSCTLTSATKDDVIKINLDLTLNTENKENLQIGVAI